MQGSNECWEPTLWGSTLWIFEFSAPFQLGETRHYLKQCDLFRSFHAIVEVQFGGLARLDHAVHNYRDNLGSLYRHPDLTLTLDKVLRNVIVSTYAHYINLWPMNGACLGHRAILMQSMLKFAMHYGHYWRRQCYLITQCRRRGLPPSTPLPAIDLATLLTDKEENLKPEQMNVSHVSIMELLGDPGNPLYAEPHSMAEHFDAMTAGARAIGELPGWTHCRDDDATAHIWGRSKTGLPKDLKIPRHEGDGWGSHCTDLPADAHSDPSHQLLRGNVLWPGHSGTVCLSVLYWRSGLHATLRGHQDIHCAQEL